MRTKACSKADRAGRADKARQFLHAAEIVEALAEDEDGLVDAYVTLCVHAGIAAADAICCARLGEHASGPNHHDATTLLARADDTLAKDLMVLLNLKTAAGYSARPMTTADKKLAGRTATRLVRAIPPT